MKIQYPKKIKVSFGGLSHKSLNTHDNLQKRLRKRCISPSVCYLCLSSAESMDHLFLHCPFATDMWIFLMKVLGLTLSFFGGGLPPRSSSGVVFERESENPFGVVLLDLSFGAYGRNIINELSTMKLILSVLLIFFHGLLVPQP